MWEAVIWVSVVGLSYVYLGYPILLAVWSACRTKPIARRPITLPVSVVIAARNEASRIAARVANCLQQDYPATHLDVVVVSDGSEDGTETVAQRIGSDRVTLVRLPNRCGKAAALNAGVAAARGEVIVFADARQRFAPTAVAELVSDFADPRVGAVTGELMLEIEPDRPGADGASLYWRMEKWVRRSEGAIDSVVGATGAIYAIRRGLFDPLPPGAILDDVLVPMRIAMKGYRVVFEPRAVAFDRVEPSYEAEFARKVRTLVGNYQAIRLCPDLVKPWRNRLFLQFCSHKLGRLAAPFGLIALLTASVALPGMWPTSLLAVQIAGYGLAAAGWRMARIGIRERWTTAAYTFSLLNIAAFVAAVRFVRGDAATALWKKPQNTSPPTFGTARREASGTSTDTAA
jgi:cellulose synthase/poly-beta-1,6-N-acetylglucosamine synthase-like glycosyltransferase